jgi:glyoxylate utilization-related uncharacterized protein
LGVYGVELGGSIPLERSGSALRIIVLSGRIKLRIGGVERVLGTGGYAAVPPGMAYRLLREGKEASLCALFLTPDSRDYAVHEGPRFLRHLEHPGS